MRKIFDSMKKLLLVLTLLFATVFTSFSQTAITESQARRIASAFAATRAFDAQEIQLVSANQIYIYNIGIQGFVIVSGNTVLPPILGYSDREIFPDMTNAPENFSAWIGHYSEMIAFAEENDIAPEAKIKRQWDEATHGVFGNRDSRSVAPLVETRWNQDCFYNEYCPETSGGWWGGPCGHAYAGCVATAMAQVMKYWNYPTTGFGSHSYVHSQYGEQSANFAATTYRWIEMPTAIYGHNDAVATLLYHCGVSVDMNYSADGSGAQSKDVETALRSYFGYCGARYRQKSSYSNDDWTSLLKAELDLSHPIYYSGANGDSGHAFVCDGYDANDMFHFNFGWSGSGDNYYSLYDVNGYSSSQAAVTNIYPVSIQADANGIIYVSQDGRGNGSSWANATDKLHFASALSSGGATRVWVKAGTYYGDTTDNEGAFRITASNRVYGGFKGDEAPDYDLSLRDFEKNPTILDGKGERRVLMQEQAFTSGTLAVWDGFTIQNGAIGSGAGAYLNNHVTLSNCNIIDNHATMYGGGVYINSTGGMARVTLKQCIIGGNSASMGGGVCDRIGADYTNCHISNNIASTKGGGLYLYNNTEPKLKNCVINNNTAKNAGGMYARGKFTAINCNFVMNLATESIGGIYHENSHNKYSNCIVWGNEANGTPNQFSGPSDFEYSAVCGIVNGTENHNIPNENDGEEPGVFVRFNQTAEGAGANYHNDNWSLQPHSICLNAGKPNTTGLGTTDINGNQRIQKGRVEIGACESCAALNAISESIAEGDTYDFFGQQLGKEGHYTAIIPTADCDSVVGLTLSYLLGSVEQKHRQIQVWPIPTDGVLHIEAEGIEAIEVRNLLGQLVLQAKETNAIDLSDLENGVYFLIVKQNSQRLVTKIVKQ